MPWVRLSEASKWAAYIKAMRKRIDLQSQRALQMYEAHMGDGPVWAPQPKQCQRRPDPEWKPE